MRRQQSRDVEALVRIELPWKHLFYSRTAANAERGILHINIYEILRVAFLLLEKMNPSGSRKRSKEKPRYFVVDQEC